MAQLPKNRVAVTAMGLVGPLGFGLAETLASLRVGRDCVSPITAFDVSRTRCRTAGQVERERLSSTAAAGEKRLHPSSQMMIAAMRELRTAAPAFTPELLIIATTSGGMSYGEAYYRALVAGKPTRKSANWVANYTPQKPVMDALASAKLSAPSQIIANACASGTNAIGHAFTLIRSGQKRRILCGGYDAISEMVFSGFDALQASTPERIRPFDRERSGLVLGEGAALLALENWDDAVARHAPIFGEVTGYGISTDNHHLTQPHPSGIGPRLAMQRALASAKLEPGEIDYINAHGTATTFNDATEGIAMTELFPAGLPVSSTKSMMGHSLGAAGAIEAVFSLLALQHGFIPPNIHHRESDPTWNFEVVKTARPAPLQHALSNSFGFGGTNATIALSRA